ncbi:50S ribosomal protein L28 [Candidatus Campbellbacteria bacterium]|nr:50S ribosomal protein L28 [Candidatus Campbellbacteria bacterium]|tara:strand:- start:700 stop:945 length:246 start_codon:yes stop_codon:yes gene_type:complete
MSRTCPITKKGSQVGGGYSNRTRATEFNPTGKRRRFPNLQKKRVYVPELDQTFVMKISTEAIKTIKKNGAYVTLKKAGIIK